MQTNQFVSRSNVRAVCIRRTKQLIPDLKAGCNFYYEQRSVHLVSFPANAAIGYASAFTHDRCAFQPLWRSNSGLGQSPRTRVPRIRTASAACGVHPVTFPRPTAQFPRAPLQPKLYPEMVDVQERSVEGFSPSGLILDIEQLLRIILRLDSRDLIPESNYSASKSVWVIALRIASIQSPIPGCQTERHFLEARVCLV